MPRLSLNLLKCLYSHCICLPKTSITFFINQRGYVHLEPPVVICTVVVVDIAARRQRFCAASLLPRMMSANDGPGGEPTRHSAVPSLSPPDATMFRFHRPLALRLPWPLQSLVVVIVPLLLSLFREPLLSSSSSSSSRLKERRSQMVKLIRGGKHTTTTAAPRRSTRAGSRRRRPGVEDDPRRFTPFLQQSLSGIGGANRATYDARSKSRLPSSPPSMPLLTFSPSGSR